MAGAYTHMVIVAEATNSFPVDQKLGKILRQNKNFLAVGSVSPDIPYLAQLALAGSTWADIMHYHRTNGILNNALHSLSAAKTKGKIWEYQLTWLLGFVGHLVADATIHPIVESHEKTTKMSIRFGGIVALIMSLGICLIFLRGQ
jgi:Zinc dependent phospholipase C